MKTYDREYFDRWYRDPRVRVATDESVARKVHLVVSVAEARTLAPTAIASRSFAAAPALAANFAVPDNVDAHPLIVRKKPAAPVNYIPLT